MSERQIAMKDFLARSGWGTASVTPLPGDASTRRYARLAMDGRKAMLMDQPQAAEGATAPADASEETRRALGYNAVARLAGADCARFAAAASWLRAHGLAAPDVYAADHGQGFVILEDLGDALFAEVLADGGDEKTLYEAAVEVLARIHAKDAPASLSSDKPLFAYDQTALLAETDLMTEWFLPLALGRAATDAEIEEHRRLWREVLAGTAGGRQVFVHRDYHAENLLWLPEREGAARVGMVDFQDALRAHPSWDLHSLLQDARRDVSPELEAAALDHYFSLRPEVEREAFLNDYAALAALNEARILGVFARLIFRDGKPRYQAFMPRMWRQLTRNLQRPALSGLKAWFETYVPAEVRS